jgi:hypothetical protein
VGVRECETSRPSAEIVREKAHNLAVTLTDSSRILKRTEPLSILTRSTK